MRCVRICYSKTGRMIYISHLDVNRMMTRAVRRAELPMWYTEGFNPHPYIAFALPLSLGQSSECEYMDIRIDSDMTNEQVRQKLSAVLPEGVKIKSAADPVFSINDIGGAKYCVRLVFENDKTAQLFAEKTSDNLKCSELLAEKRGKKGRRKVIKQVNLIEQIFESSVECENNSVILQLYVKAGNEVNLNPALLVETLEKYSEIYSQQMYIERKDIITSDGKSFC